MKAEIQHKEPQQAASIQSKGEISKLSFVDNRPQASSQGKLIKSIQKKENKTGLPDDMSGLVSVKYETIQRASVVQRMLLDGLAIGDLYANDHENDIIAHMGGEWNGNNGGAVGGGHLLNKIVASWGPAVANSVPTPGPNVANGVHFPGNIPRVNRVTQNQFTFRLVTTNGTKRVSQPKTSTFWPTNWSQQDLKKTLQNSWQLGDQENYYASKENTSYWYAWQSLGDNTLFPNKILQVTGTERQRMHRGRTRM